MNWKIQLFLIEFGIMGLSFIVTYVMIIETNRELKWLLISPMLPLICLTTLYPILKPDSKQQIGSDSQ